MSPGKAARHRSTIATYSGSSASLIRDSGSYPAGIGMWHENPISRIPRSSARRAYSSGAPRAWLQSGVCRW